ncbi:MAG TPA: ABC transporter ATP-binding protein [Terriglobales bacterium]|nr:ABC transporter ATP-binding protein [Terriglobales bacterium]
MERTEVAKGNILTVSNLKVTFHTYAGDVKALDGVELSVKRGEFLGLVGESGCGKSVTALALVGLLPPNAEVMSGELLLNEVNLLGLNAEKMRQMRLSDVAIVFQDPMTYLNPVLTIGSQITEIIASKPDLFTPAMIKNRLKEISTTKESNKELDSKTRAEREKLQKVQRNRIRKEELNRLAKDYTISILKSVKLSQPEKVFGMYPFELSGGMRQRAMIAMALIRSPKLLLADEITTALDVTVQAQILKLLQELKQTIDTSVILITHDLAVVAEVCDRVAVMYAGNVVEVAAVEELFSNPLHPYTQALLATVPRVDVTFDEQKSIRGSVPDLIYPPTGCRFHPRCPKAFAKCPTAKPTLIETKPGHQVSCFLYGG